MWKKSNINSRIEVNKEGKLRTWHGGWGRFKELKTRKDKDGYVIVGARDSEGKGRTYRVHRLIADAFIPNPDDLPVINHKNGIKDDNRIDNLEWSTISQNTQHAYDELGVVSPASEKVLLLIKGKPFATYDSITKMSNMIGIDRNNIQQFEKISGGYFTFEIVGKDTSSINHNKEIWKQEFKLNPRGSFYRVDGKYYDKVSEILEEYKKERTTFYRWVKEGHPKGIEVKKVTCKDFLENTEFRNW